MVSATPSFRDAPGLSANSGETQVSVTNCVCAGAGWIGKIEIALRLMPVVVAMIAQSMRGVRIVFLILL